MDIKIFTTWGVRREVLCEGGEMFFLTEQLYYFINVIIQTLHISSFILVQVDILHIVNIVMFRCVNYSPPLKNCSSATKNASSPTLFDVGG